MSFGRHTTTQMLLYNRSIRTNKSTHSRNKKKTDEIFINNQLNSISKTINTTNTVDYNYMVFNRSTQWRQQLINK